MSFRNFKDAGEIFLIRTEFDMINYTGIYRLGYYDRGFFSYVISGDINYVDVYVRLRIAKMSVLRKYIKRLIGMESCDDIFDIIGKKYLNPTIDALKEYSMDNPNDCKIIFMAKLDGKNYISKRFYGCKDQYYNMVYNPKYMSSYSSDTLSRSSTDEVVKTFSGDHIIKFKKKSRSCILL